MFGALLRDRRDSLIVIALIVVALLLYRLQTSHPKLYRWTLIILISICLCVILYDRVLKTWLSSQ